MLAQPLSPPSDAESAGSSPTKLPLSPTLKTSPAFKPASPFTFGAPSSTPAPQNPTFSPKPIFALPAPSPDPPAPKASFDNPAFRREEPNLSGGWSIPASSHEAKTAASSETLAKPSNKPGAAAKVGRRDAWLKFMAYDGAVKVCVSSLLQGQSATPAAGFLKDDFREIVEALSLGSLLLNPNHTGLGNGNGSETAIYWDDREEHGGAVLERVTVKEVTSQRSQSPPRQEQQQRRQAPVAPQPQPPPQAPQSAPLDLAMTPLGNAQERFDPPSRTVDLSSSIVLSRDSVITVVEASIVRVVGCPMLGAYGSTKRTGGSRAMGDFAIVMHPAGTLASEDGAWTTVTLSGAAEAPGVLRLHPNEPSGTIIVELYNGDHQIAAGTTQASEIHRCAMQRDSLEDDAPMAAGFLRNLMPAFGRRKDGTSAASQGSSSSMAWVRLVDGNGADAGHVVIAAKVTTAPASAAPSLTASQSHSQGHSHQHTASQARAPTPPAVSRSTASCLHSQQHHSQHRYSVAEDYEADSTTTKEVVRMEVRGAGVGRAPTTAGGYLHVNGQHVYDVLLEAALVAADCGSGRLALKGPWAWLVNAYAQRYGVRPQYATLAYLRWVVRTDIAAPTGICLGALDAGLGPILVQRDASALTSSELALLAHVLERVDQMLNSLFENYFALSETADGGLVDGMLSVRNAGGAPPALRPAVALLAKTRPGQDSWLVSRLKNAARKRFDALLAATEARRAPKADRRRASNAAGSNEADNPDMVWAYIRVDDLCSCVIGELRADESIHAAAVIPLPVPLPAVTSVEYIRGTISYLKHVLVKYPPPAPTIAAVKLVESVGRLQSYLERHGHVAAAALLNSKDIFGGYVEEWLVNTGKALARILRALDRAGPPALSGWSDLQNGVKSRVCPLIEGMLSEVEAEMKKYARIVGYWPGHGQDLEVTLVSVLRDAAAAASGQCGLVRTKVDDISPPMPSNQAPIYMHQATACSQATAGSSQAGGKRVGRVAWRWIKVGAGGHGSAFSDAPSPLRRGIDPHQALLLNSLRRLLAVVPQMEEELRKWCAGKAAANDPRQSMAAFPPPSQGDERLARDAPDLGAHWAQLIKEFRTEYYACCTLTVESLAAELSSTSMTSVIGVLRREALSASPAALDKQLRKVLDALSPSLRWLAAALDGRVFVALVRGLWDMAARDVLRFAEDLVDSGSGETGAWRARQGAGAALHSLDSFYRAELAAAMGSDLADRDLAPPQHAQRAAALLADNTTEVNLSFDVY